MSPLVLLGASLTLVALVTALSGIWHYTYELDYQKKLSVHTTPTAARTSPTPSVELAAAAEPADTPQPTARRPQTHANSTPAVAGASTPPGTAPATVEVSLSVNSDYKGKVSLPAGSTQCDVLQAALDSNIIFGLDMRYSDQYGTNGVYVINGIGDSGAIWWTYTVNGKSPPYGCGGTKANSGDSVNWKYVKQ